MDLATGGSLLMADAPDLRETVPAPVPAVRRNPVRTRADWEAMRAAALTDPGALHGGIAKATLHWFWPSVGSSGAWLTFDSAQRCWSGWDAATLDTVMPDLPVDAEPWERAFNADDPPHWRWFEGGFTNACFNEVDRHVLSGQGAEPALIFEGDRWDMSLDGGRGGPVDCYPVSRKRLLLETALCALALKALGLRAGDRIALNMPSIPAQLYWTEAAKRLGILYTPVFGGFSDKTLSDRIADAGARIVITADGGWRTAQVVPFKTAYTDPALDNFVPVVAARAVVEDASAGLGLDPDASATISATVAEGLAGELTVERSDVMRAVGRALGQLTSTGALDAAAAARARIAIASALVDGLPPRVEKVVVVRHAGVPDLVWRPERDVWAHEVTEAALGELLSAVRAAGHAVATREDLLALA
ncbi:MAG: AMP-binding protein, partial [Thermaurantiacus sp.]